MYYFSKIRTIRTIFAFYYLNVRYKCRLYEKSPKCNVLIAPFVFHGSSIVTGHWHIIRITPLFEKDYAKVLYKCMRIMMHTTHANYELYPSSASGWLNPAWRNAVLLPPPPVYIYIYISLYWFWPGSIVTLSARGMRNEENKRKEIRQTT